MEYCKSLWGNKYIIGCFIYISNDKKRVYIDKFKYQAESYMTLYSTNEKTEIVHKDGLIIMNHASGPKFIIPKLKLNYENHFDSFFEPGELKKYGVYLTINRTLNNRGECVVKIAKKSVNDNLFFLYACNDQLEPLNLTWKHIKKVLAGERVKKYAKYHVKNHNKI